MADSEHFQRETARLQNQQRGAQAALQSVSDSQVALAQISSSVERANQEALLESQKALAQAELNRIAEDLRRLELAKQERERQEAIQKQAQEKETTKGQEQQKTEAAEKERQSKEAFEKQEREKQEAFQKEQQLKAEAAAKEQLEKEALQKQEQERQEARQKEEEAKRREENAISETAAAHVFAAAQAADALIEVAKSVAVELEKRALE